MTPFEELNDFEGLENAINALKMMANPYRLAILCLLTENELSVNQIGEKVGLNQSALSQHLAKLRRDGLVDRRRDHNRLFYYLVGRDTKKIIALLKKLYCNKL